MEQDFNSWNKEKQIINKKVINRNLYFYEREIWWCSIGQNIGVEINGKNENFERPVLIIKKLNSEMVWVLAMTTKGRNGSYYYRIQGEFVDSWVAMTQVKAISTKRLLRKMGMIPKALFKEILLALCRQIIPDIESSP